MPIDIDAKFLLDEEEYENITLPKHKFHDKLTLKERREHMLSNLNFLLSPNACNTCIQKPDGCKSCREEKKKIKKLLFGDD